VIASWTCPGPGGPTQEYAAAFDGGRAVRLLIVPALFEEANRTRRFIVETMRLLDNAGIDSILPDLPGCNESLQSFEVQSLATWRDAVAAARRHFAPTYLLTIRGGALIVPDDLPGWRLEPVAGLSLLRQLLRARTIAAREDGRDEKLEMLLEQGRAQGLELAGYHCSAALIAGLEDGVQTASEVQMPIRQAQLGGGALWLRSEPSEDHNQSAALAAIVIQGTAA